MTQIEVMMRFEINTTITRLGVECNEVLIGDGLYTCGSYNLQKVVMGHSIIVQILQDFSSNIKIGGLRL